MTAPPLTIDTSTIAGTAAGGDEFGGGSTSDRGGAVR